MTDRRLIFMAALGLITIVLGMVTGDLRHIYLGIGAWIAGALFYSFFTRNRELSALVLGIITLHTGIILVYDIDRSIQKPEVFGIITFIAGVVMVLNSGWHKKQSLCQNIIEYQSIFLPYFLQHIFLHISKYMHQIVNWVYS